MAQAFNLTAQLNLRGPNNVGRIVSSINRQLQNINANVNLNINQNTQNAITRVNAGLTALNATLATTSANVSNAAAAVNNLTQALSGMANINANQQLNAAANAAQQLGNNAGAAAGGGAGGGGGMNQLRTEMEEFGRQSALAVRRFAAFSLVTSVVFSLTNAFNQAFKSFVDFDKEIVRLQQVTGESASGLQKLTSTITELSTSLGISSSELIGVSSTLAQAGLSAKDTEKALKALALSSLAPSFDNMNDTVEGSIALMRQFGISAGQLESALGSVNAVAAAFAVESSDIIAAIQRTGGVFASASKGVSEGTQALNEFIAVFTSVRQTTRESAETIATGLRTIFTRIQRSSTIEALKEFNVNLTDSEGKFVGAYKAIELLSRGLNSIDPRDLKFSQIVEELGGFRQIGKVIPLIQQFNTAQQALAVAQAGQTSLTEDAAIAQLSLANQFAKVREEFVAMVREIGGTDTFQTMVKGALALASGLIKLADSAKSVLPVIAALTAMRGLGALRQFGTGFAGGIRGGGAREAANGGLIRGYKAGGNIKDVPVALMPGETVVYPELAANIGVSKLRKLNHADKKMARGGGVGLVPGSGSTDSFYTTLPEGSFVIRKAATKALGGPTGVMQAAGYKRGGFIQKFKEGSEQAVSHLGSTRIEKKYFETAGGKVVYGEALDNYTIALERGLNRDLRDIIGKGKTGIGIKPQDLLEHLQSTPTETLFATQLFGTKPGTTKKGRGGYGYPTGATPEDTALIRAEFAKIADSVKQSMINGLKDKMKSFGNRNIFDSDLGFMKDIFREKIQGTKNAKLIDAFEKINEARVYSKDPENQALRVKQSRSARTTRVAKELDDPPITMTRKAFKQRRRVAAAGGPIQYFAEGSVKPLESMGKEPLIKEALRTGVLKIVPAGFRDSIDKRGKAFDKAIYDKLIADLKQRREIIEASEISKKQKRSKVAVVGLYPPEKPIEPMDVDLPGATKTAGQKKKKSIPATLNVGSLQDSKLIQRIEATNRNNAIRGSQKTAMLLAQAAGQQQQYASLEQQVALRKKIRASTSSEQIGFGYQNAFLGLQGQSGPSGSADLAQGLSKPYADIVGIPPNIPTDITLGTSLEESARRKATGTRPAPGGGRTSSQLYRAVMQSRRSRRKKALGGFIPFAAGDAVGSLKNYFRSSAKVNLGLANKDKLSKEQRQKLSKEVKNINSLATPGVPDTLYASFSRTAFDRFAGQTGLNKNPEIPEGTGFFDKSKFYAQEVLSIVGKQFRLPGFLSTSKQFGVAKSFLDNASRSKDKWAAMATIKTKPKARGIDVEKQLAGQNINNFKMMKNRRNGKMEQFKMKGPSDEQEVLLPPKSKFRINSAKFVDLMGNKNVWLDVQQLKKGGFSKAPLIDDIAGDVPGTYPPVPSGGKLLPAIQKIISAGGGALDYDGTLMKHTGDEAYAKAKTPAEKEAVLAKYYRSEKDRIDSGRPTQFAKELQKAIKDGLIKPQALTVISASRRLPVVEQDIISRFGIPKDNLIFTQGGSKSKAVSAFREKGPRASRVSRAAGGEIPILAQEGEYVINKKSAKSIGYGNLERLNKYHSGGKVQRFADGGSIGPENRRIVFPGIRKGSVPKMDSLGQVVEQLASMFRSTLGTVKLANQKLQNISNFSAPLAAAIRDYTIELGLGASEQLEVISTYERVINANKVTAQDTQRMIGALNTYTTGLQQTNAANLAARQAVVARSQTTQTTTPNNPKSRTVVGGFPGNAPGISPINRPYTPPVPPNNLFEKFKAAINNTARIFADTATYFKTKISTGVGSLTTSLGNAGSSIGRGAGMFGNRNPPPNPFASMGGSMGAAAQNTQQTQRNTRERGGFGNSLMALSFALPMLAEQFTVSEPQTQAQAQTNALASGLGQTAGVASAVGSMGGILGPIAAVGVSLVGIVRTIDDMDKAAKQFIIDSSRKKIEQSGEKLSQIFEEINKKGSATPEQLKSLNDALAISAEAALQVGNAATDRNVGNMQSITESLFSLVAGRGAEGEQNQKARSLIFEKQGFTGLFKAMSGGAAVQDQMFRDLAPSLARETSKGYAIAASQAKSVFEQQFKSGKSIEDLMSGPEWNKQAELLARSNSVIQEQILLIQNTNTLNEAEKKARIDSIIATEAETQVRKQFAEVKAAEDLRKLQKEINNISFSFNRMLGNIDAAIQSSVTNLAALDESLSLASTAAAGQAKVGKGVSAQKTLDILKKPESFGENERNIAFGRAASPFGSQAGNIQKVLKAGAGLESTVLGTINRTLSGTKGETQEAVTAKIESALRSQFKDLQLPPSLADKLSKQISGAVGKLRQEGEDTIDYSQLVENVPELSKSIDIFKNTADQASRALEFNKQAFDKLADSVNQQIDLTVEANARTRNAQNIIAKGSMDLKRAFGMNISLGERRSAIEAPIRSMTGGTTNPVDIGANYRQLENQRQQLQVSRNQAADAGDVGAVRTFDSQLSQTSVALRENIDALKSMADSSDLASAALEEIDKAQKRQQAGVSIMERLVTSTPKELANMNQAFARLDANMRGIAVGGTSPEQRKQSLEIFQMIAPFLGDQEKGLQANVLQSMLAESGIGMTPMMQQILDSMRNPIADPQQALAIQTYQEATSKQAEANLQLAKINTDLPMLVSLANDISTKTGNAVAEAIKNNTIKFEEQQLKDLLNGINRVPTEATPAVPAVGKANGGLIYKAIGGTIFQPKGTDTVPAMLTPGEFVVNRRATQANLPLLKSINNGYSKGGKVKYLAGGGVVSNILNTDSSLDNKDLDTTPNVSNEDLPVYNPQLYRSTTKISKINAIPAAATSVWDYNGLLNGLSPYFDVLKESGGSTNYSAGKKVSSVSELEAYNTDIIRALGRQGGSENMKSAKVNFQVGKKDILGYAPSVRFSLKRQGFGNKYIFPIISDIQESAVSKALGKAETGVQAQTLGSIPFPIETLTSLAGGSDIPIIGRSRLREGNNTADLSKYSEQKLLDINDSSEYGYAEKQLTILKNAKALFEGANAMPDVIDVIKNISSSLITKAPETNLGPLDQIDSVFKLYAYALQNQTYDPTVAIPNKYSAAFLSSTDQAGTISLPKNTGNVLVGAASNKTMSDVVGFDKSDLSALPPTQASSGQNLITEEIAKNMTTKFMSYKGTIDAAVSELEAYIQDNNNFTSTSTQTQKSSSIDSLLQKIYDNNWPGLYITLPTENLNDVWKSKSPNGLAVFKSDLSNIWNDKIQLALSGPNKALYQKTKGYGLNGNSEKVLLSAKEYTKEFPWIGDVNVAKMFADSILKPQQEQSQKEFASAFTIDDQPTPYSQKLTNIALDQIAPGLSKDINPSFSFLYKKIKVPKLTRNTGYVPGSDALEGILISPGSINTTALDPFGGNSIAELTGGEGTIFANSIQEIQNKLVTAYEKYYGTNGKQADPGAFDTFSLARLAPPQMWMSTEERQKAYVVEEGDITNPWFAKTSADLFKNRTVTTAGGQAATIPGATVSIGDKLKTAQQLINQIIAPKIGVLRGFGYNLYPLSAAAQIGQYSEGLTALAKSFGSRIVGQGGNINPVFADVWGRVSAVGETFKFLAKDDFIGLGNKIGLAQSALGAGIGVSNIISQVLQYADFLTKQGSFLAGVSGQAQATLGKGLAGDQQVEGQSLTEIFKQATDSTIAKDGKISTTSATPPKTLLDLGKKVFNPYNSFANANDRFNLINYLMDQLKGQVNQRFVDGVNTLRDYLKIQDSAILAPEDQRTNLLNSLGDYALANSALLALTNGAFGALPDVAKITQLASLRDAQKQAEKDKAQQQAQNPQAVGKANGGIVYASNGALVNYQPRGTDTVPAMLTPGEFVVNRSATQKHLPLLRAINDGSGHLSSISTGFNNGGLVNYLQSGGIILPKYYANPTGVVTGGNTVVGGGKLAVDASSAGRVLEQALTTGTRALQQVVQNFGINTESMTAINNFVNGVKAVTQALANINITPEVKFTGSVDVRVQGVEGLTGPMRDLVNSAINNAMSRLQSANTEAKLEVPQGDFTGS
jgi:TP901 family phage tail tape measure protein